MAGNTRLERKVYSKKEGTKEGTSQPVTQIKIIKKEGMLYHGWKGSQRSHIRKVGNDSYINQHHACKLGKDRKGCQRNKHMKEGIGGRFGCPLPDKKFIDFWLSFMVVVSTFVYLAANDEASKRTIHTVVAILTALMAETGATRSSNIVLVIAIGAIGLLAGWLIEFFARYKRGSFSAELLLNMLQRLKDVNIIDSENQGSTNTNYQLTRQDSLSRGEEQPGNA
ncbi:EGF-like domain-containing protein [Tanacetum coccineum]